MSKNETNMVSKALVDQRMRNNAIDNLELASDFASQLQYQNAVPFVNISNEVICQWGDVMLMSDEVLQDLPSPLYDKAEIKALAAYHRDLQKICDLLPDPLPEIDELQTDANWKKLRNSAKKTLNVMMRRGPFSDDVEHKEFI